MQKNSKVFKMNKRCKSQKVKNKKMRQKAIIIIVSYNVYSIS